MFSRRRGRTRWFWALCAMVAMALVPGIGKAEERRLNIFAWADYISPELLASFERETGIKVRLTPYESAAEMRDGLHRQPEVYDLVVPYEYDAKILIGQGLLQKVSASQLTGFGNVEENWRGRPFDPANDYTVPFHWGTTSFVVDTALWSGPTDSLALLFDPPPELSGKVAWLMDSEDVVTMAMRFLGMPQCSDRPQDLAQVEALLKRNVDKVRLLEAGALVEALAEGKLVAAMAWNGDALRARFKRPSLRYVYPREGVTLWTDTLAVPKGARHVEEARIFMAFMLEPRNAARQTGFSHYANAIRGSDLFVAPGLAEAPELILPLGARLHFLQSCRRTVYENYDRLWRRLLAMRKPG